MSSDQFYRVGPDQDWKLVQITDHLMWESGLWAGQHLYSWREQAFSPDTGLTQDASPAKLGDCGQETGTVPRDPASPLVEVSNKLARIGSYQFARLRGLLHGQMVWEFQDGDANRNTYWIEVAGRVTGQLNFTDCDDYPSDQCKPIYHYGQLFIWDDACQKRVFVGWTWVKETLSRQIPAGRPFPAQWIGTKPGTLDAVVFPPSTDPPAPDDDLWEIDLGDPTRPAKASNELGKMCENPTGTDPSEEFGLDPDNMTLWLGSTYLWDEDFCTFDGFEMIIMGDINNCPYDPEIRYSASFHKMIANWKLIEAFGEIYDNIDPDGCTPFFLTNLPRPKGILGIKCVDNCLEITSASPGKCGETVTSRVCCDGSGPGGSFEGCGFDEVPNQYYVTIPTPTNNTCLICSLWGDTFLFDNPDQGNCWVHDFTPSCPGLACTQQTLCCEGDYMVADICGATYRKLLVDWVPMGSNTMDLFGTPHSACNWPSTITATAVV